jgi:hypothetical protein
MRIVEEHNIVSRLLRAVECPGIKLQRGPRFSARELAQVHTEAMAVTRLLSRARLRLVLQDPSRCAAAAPTNEPNYQRVARRKMKRPDQFVELKKLAPNIRIEWARPTVLMSETAPAASV